MQVIDIIWTTHFQCEGTTYSQVEGAAWDIHLTQEDDTWKLYLGNTGHSPRGATTVSPLIIESTHTKTGDSSLIHTNHSNKLEQISSLHPQAHDSLRGGSQTPRNRTQRCPWHIWIRQSLGICHYSSHSHKQTEKPQQTPEKKRASSDNSGPVNESIAVARNITYQ